MTTARRARGAGPDVGCVSRGQPRAVRRPGTATVLVVMLSVRHGVGFRGRVRAGCEDLGDLLRSVRSDRADICFELASEGLTAAAAALGKSVTWIEGTI